MALGSLWYALLFVSTFGLQYSYGQQQPRISEAFYSEVKTATVTSYCELLPVATNSCLSIMYVIQCNYVITILIQYRLVQEGTVISGMYTDEVV